MCKTDNVKLLWHRKLSLELGDDPEGWDGEAREGGHICILIAESRCTAETNTTL